MSAAQSCVTGMMDMGKLMDAPEVLASHLRVLKFFPKSKVEGVEFAEAAPAMVITEPPPEVAPEAGSEPEANPDEAFE